MKQIGLMGGTFNPIHNAHLAMAAAALEQMALDEIWFMPSGHPPHKKSRLVTQGKEREDMVKLAIASVSYFVYSDFELKREGNTYTAQTLTLLREAYPQHEFYFMIIEHVFITGYQDRFRFKQYIADGFQSCFNQRSARFHHVGNSIGNT